MRDKLRRELQIALLPADWFQFLPKICIQNPTLDTKGRINTTDVCESSPPYKQWTIKEFHAMNAEQMKQIEDTE